MGRTISCNKSIDLYRLYGEELKTCVKLFKYSNIRIEPGVTCLVGCNGSGKSTMLKFIQYYLKMRRLRDIVIINSTDVIDTFASVHEYVTKHRGDEELWILLDGVDAHLSIDEIDDLRSDLFQSVIDQNVNSDVYIVVATNSYETCADYDCIDVSSGKHMVFKKYHSFKRLMLNTRYFKDKQ